MGTDTTNRGTQKYTNSQLDDKEFAKNVQAQKTKNIRAIKWIQNLEEAQWNVIAQIVSAV